MLVIGTNSCAAIFVVGKMCSFVLFGCKHTMLLHMGPKWNKNYSYASHPQLCSSSFWLSWTDAVIYTCQVQDPTLALQGRSKTPLSQISCEIPMETKSSNPTTCPHLHPPAVVRNRGWGTCCLPRPSLTPCKCHILYLISSGAARTVHCKLE